jgi:hypothetical protein
MRDRDVRAELLRDRRKRHDGDGSRIVDEMDLLQGEVRINVAVINAIKCRRTQSTGSRTSRRDATIDSE